MTAGTVSGHISCLIHSTSVIVRNFHQHGTESIVTIAVEVAEASIQIEIPKRGHLEVWFISISTTRLGSGHHRSSFRPYVPGSAPFPPRAVASSPITIASLAAVADHDSRINPLHLVNPQKDKSSNNFYLSCHLQEDRESGAHDGFRPIDDLAFYSALRLRNVRLLLSWCEAGATRLQVKPPAPTTAASMTAQML